MAGPVADVMKHASRSRTGGLPTSALALGLTAAAIDFLQTESALRPELELPTRALCGEYELLTEQLLQLAEGCGRATADDIRSRR